MTLSSRRAAKCRGLSEGECGICGCLAAFRGLCVVPKSSKGGVTDSLSAILIASFLPLTGRADFANPLCHPSPNLRIFRWRREIRRASFVPPLLPYEIIAKGVGKLYRLHIPQRLPLELVGQVGNAVTPAVILRKPINDFLHCVTGTHDVRLDFISQIGFHRKRLILS